MHIVKDALQSGIISLTWVDKDTTVQNVQLYLGHRLHHFYLLVRGHSCTGEGDGVRTRIFLLANKDGNIDMVEHDSHHTASPIQKLRQS